MLYGIHLSTSARVSIVLTEIYTLQIVEDFLIT